MPAAAVKPSLRVADVFIGPKASVGGLVRPTLKTATQLSEVCGKLLVLAMGEVSRTAGVRVKFYNPCRTTDGEGSSLEHVRR